MSKKATKKLEINSAEYVLDMYDEILEIEKSMLALSSTDDYYVIQKSLQSKLAEFIRLNFTYLNTRQLLKLCSLVNSHRPIALHSFLIYCSDLIND